MIPPESSPYRVLAFLRGDADGDLFQRIRHYSFRPIIGGLVGFFIVAMATPSREGKGEGFPLEIYLGAFAVGAIVMLAFSIVPRLLHPKDWPTREEFRRGAESKKDERG